MPLTISVVLGVVAMFSYGFAVAFSQPLSRQLDPAQFLFLRGVAVSVVLAVAALPSLRYRHGVGALAGTIGLGMAGYGPVLAFTHGLKVSRLGIVAPIAGTAPLVTVVLSAAVLEVAIRPVQWVAVVLIVAANVTVSVDIRNWRSPGPVARSSGIPYAIAAAMGWGLFFYFLVGATNAVGPWLSAWLVEVGVTAAAGLHVWLTGKPTTLAAVMHPGVAANGMLLSVGTVAFTLGVRYGNAGIVAVLSNSNALVATIVGAALFQERLTRLERASAAVMLLGVALIAAT